MRVFKDKKNKKAGFSLMELAIAVMIVALLIVIIVPIIQNQLAKSDEYAYYMAYRNVEKLGGQIVALGDPEDEMYKSQFDDSTKIAGNVKKNTFLVNIKSVFSNIGTRFAYTEHFVFKNLFPKSFADDETLDSTIDSDMYDEAVLMFRVCQNGENVKNEENPTNADGSTRYYTCSELMTHEEEGTSGTSSATWGNEQHKDSNGKVISTDYNYNFAVVRSLLPANGCFLGSAYEKTTSSGTVQDTDKVNSALATLEGYLKQKKSFASYCSALATYCNGTDDNENTYKVKTELRTNEEVDDEDGTTTVYSYCDSYVTRPSDSGSSGSTSFLPVTAPKMPNVCKSAPYYGMRNANEVTTDENESESINCVCRTGSVTANNEKVCCASKSGYNSYAPTTVSASARTAYNNYAGTTSVAANTDTDYCRYCTGEYNPVNDWCCPEHSVYNGTACECANGYEMEKPGTSAERCKKTKCADGYHTDKITEVCVPNAPIIKGKRLCELIHSNWNIVPDSTYCNAFTTENNVSVNKAVLEAAKGNGGSGYLSINSKQGAFAKVRPNIVLANGLRLWILGDKAASIPGLSYNPVGITSTQNMCRELLKSSNEPLSTRALCDAAGGYFCAGEAHCYTLDSASLEKMGDARNCCASTDLSTIDYSAGLEKDNRAFAVGGFTVFVDINGGAKGSSTLWEDIFPFYVGTNGRVYPGYPLDAPKAKNAVSNDVYLAGNSVKNIPVDVYYFETTASGSARKRIVAYSNVSYARGICYAKLVGSHTPYCKNLGLKARGMGTDVSKVTEMIDSNSNPCTNNNCFISVRNKLRFF